MTKFPKFAENEIRFIMKDGFLRVASVAPRVYVADVTFNLNQTLGELHALEDEGVELAVFPECGLTAYTCADLFHSQTLLDAAAAALRTLIDESRDLNLGFIVGLPLRTTSGLCNCAAYIHRGSVRLTAKSYIPNYNEFYERRWWSAPDPGTTAHSDFGPVSTHGVWQCHGALIGIEICEDLWVPRPPSEEMAMKGAEVICNLSASDDLIGKYAYLRSLVAQQSARCICAYAYAGAGYGESSTDLVFDAKAMIAENGSMLAEGQRWQADGSRVIADIDILALRRDRMHMTTFADCARNAGITPATTPTPDDSHPQHSDLKYRTVNPHPFIPADSNAIDDRCEEIIQIQTAGLARRLDFIKCRSLVVGISGGLDSTLALLVAVRAFDRLALDRKSIIGVTMPGFGTTGRTHDNAVRLMQLLGVSMREISIVPAVNQHFSDIGHDPSVHDVTYENSQARQRTLLLMDIANQTSGIVLGTGDLSELALGWATYNGDHMSMYGVNAGVPKTLVRWLVRWFATQQQGNELSHTLLDILDTPVSPELLPASADGSIAQKTEDLVGPYELHDFFLYYTLRFGFSPERIGRLARRAFTTGQYSDDTIQHWLKTFFRRFFSQQFKRSCMPDGPKVGSVCLSPRGDWRMPSDASSALWR